MKRLYKKIRQNFYRFVNRKYLKGNDSVFINAKCKFNKKMELGSNVHFNGFKIKGNGKVKIGNNFHSGLNINVITSNHNYEGESLPYDNVIISKDVIIGNQVWIGDHVIILGGVSIGDGAIIQAGSVVSSNIPACSIAGGNPARVFKERDKDHYEKLLKEKKFS